MSSLNTLHKNIAQILNEAQLSRSSHEKCVLSLSNIYRTTAFETFFNVFTLPLNVILQADLKTSIVIIERALDFIALFSISPRLEVQQPHESPESKFLQKLFSYLLKAQSVECVEVRYRSCQLLNKIIDKMVDKEVDITYELFEKLQEAMLERIKDSKAAVRLLAINAVHRLQDPTDLKDPVIHEYTNAIYDGNAKVRRLAVEKIACIKPVIEHIVGRTRDVDPGVRIAAFTKLSKMVKFLTIAQRQMVMLHGSVDEDAKVKYYVTNKLIPEWLNQYDNKHFELIEAVRLDADDKDIAKSTKVSEFILESLFRCKPLSETIGIISINGHKTLEFGNLNWNTAIYWRCLIQYLHVSDHYEEQLDTILPEIIQFCDYIEQYCKWKPKTELTIDLIEQQFILEQLLIILRNYDLGDEASRQYLNKSISKLLQNEVNLDVRVISTCMEILENSIPNVETRCKFVCEIISEIIYPLNCEETAEKQKNASDLVDRLKDKMLELIQLKENAVREESFKDAEEYNSQINDLKLSILNAEEELKKCGQVAKRTDVPTLEKYLDIAAALLCSAQVKVLSPTLATLKEDVEVLLMHDKDSVKTKALKCYALFCTMDKGCAQIGVHICSAPILAYHAEEECDVQTLLIAIGGVVDMLLLYGLDLMAAPDEELSETRNEQHRVIFTGGTSLTSIIQGLVDLMDDDNPEIQTQAVRGLCSLIVCNRIQSPSLISRLILKWYSPSTDDELQDLKQIIGMTLQKGATLPQNSNQFENAVLPTIRALARAPRKSPLNDVYSDVMRFTIALCSTSPDSDKIQTNLAMSICELINNDTKSAFNVAYSEVLLMLNLPSNEETVDALLEEFDELQDVVANKKVVKNIVKFISKLKKMYSEIHFQDENMQANNNKLTV